MGRRLRTSDYDVTDPMDVIFSYIDGFVWVSWPGAVAMGRVGRYENVTAAMRDFLAQCEVGERLANGTHKLKPTSRERALVTPSPTTDT